jgi:hypothetical protein
MKKITIAGLLVFQTVFVFLPLLVVSIKQHAAVAYAARPLREAYQQPKCGLRIIIR